MTDTAADDPTKEELLHTPAGSFDTDSLRFEGLRGDSRRHLPREALEAAIAALAPAPRDRGTVELLLARGPNGERSTPGEVHLSASGGMPGDRWADEERYGLDYQLATTRWDLAKLIANGQPVELHGDNLFLQLDLSAGNLPVGSTVQLGQAVLEVTPQAHNGCKKWAQRFGLPPMQYNLDPVHRAERLRGMYFRVVEEGPIRVGDAVTVLQRAPQ